MRPDYHTLVRTHFLFKKRCKFIIIYKNIIIFTRYNYTFCAPHP